MYKAGVGTDEIAKRIRAARLIVLAGLVIGLSYYIRLWTLDPHGFSILSKRLPY